MDSILKLFLDAQQVEGTQLARASDLLDFLVLDAQRFVATYSCRGLVRDATGLVRQHDRFALGIRLPENYLEDVNPMEILTWLGPAEIWHPNIRPPFVCAGRIPPGTPVVDLLHRGFEMITWANVTMREDDALNPAACAWARRNRERFPIDTRPIKRPLEPLALGARELRP